MTGSSRHEDYDVAVVGASLAGCTTATLLARQGLSVALLERHAGRDAYKRVCTHFIQPCGTPTLQRLGLSDAIEAVGGVRNSLDIWSQAGWVVGRHHRPNGECAYGYTIRREKLDPMLRALAAETPGVDLLPGLTVKRLSSERGRINGLVAHGRDRSERGIRARLVVGADGRGSTVAGLAGVRPRTIENRRFLYYAYFRDLRLASAPAGQMWFAEPDVAYAYPCDDGLTLVACALRRDRLEAFKAAPESEFARVFANLPEAPALEGSERVSPLIGKLDMPTLTARPRQRASLSPATRPWPPIPCGRLDAAGRFNPPSGWPITRGRRWPARASSTVPCPDTGGFTGAASSPTTWRAPATRRDGACCRTSASSSAPACTTR